MESATPKDGAAKGESFVLKAGRFLGLFDPGGGPPSLSRKFEVLIIGTILLCFGKLHGSEWVILATGYSIVNVLQKFAPPVKEFLAKRAQNGAPPASPPGHSAGGGEG